MGKFSIRAVSDKRLKNPAAPMNRDLHFVPTSWMQGMFCLAAVLRATVRNSANFLIRSLTPQPRKAGFPLRSNKLRGMRSLLQFNLDPVIIFHL